MAQEMSRRTLLQLIPIALAPPVFAQARASAIVYAPRDMPALAALDWPEWTADRPGIGTRFKAGDPVCTVLAHAATAAGARELAQERLKHVLASTGMDKP